MKKISANFSTAQIAVAVAAVMLFVLSFFTVSANDSKDCAVIRNAAGNRNEFPLPHPQHKLQSNILRTAVPAVNSSRNESSSNPPLNRAYGALFSRTFIEIANAFCAVNFNIENSVFHQYLINSIPVRAGPFVC